MFKTMFVVLCFAWAISTLSEAHVGSGKAGTVVMNDGREIPILGIGTWLNGGAADGVQRAIETALDVGYRHIDTAAIYDTERDIGRAIKNKIADGTVTRDDIFVTTKLWNDKHAEDQVIPALRESLEKLQLDYVDLYLIHWPINLFSNHAINNDPELDFVKTWRAMEEAQRLGLTKSIGVSNFNEKQLERLLDSATVKPAVNQVEVNPNLTQKNLQAFCANYGILLVAYSPLGSMPEPKSKKNAPAPKLDDPILTAIGNKYNKNTVQVVLRYLIDRGLIPIPKSVTPLRIQQNIDVFDFHLTPEEMQQIDNFNLDYRSVSPDVWKDSNEYPF